MSFVYIEADIPFFLTPMCEPVPRPFVATLLRRRAYILNNPQAMPGLLFGHIIICAMANSFGCNRHV